jgi:cell division protein FtsI (penicillin-binding protein 3)
MSDNTNIERMVGKFKIAFYIALATAVLVVFRIAQLQYFTPDKITADDIYTETVIDAKRGSILATDGRPMAISVPSFQIRMDCVAPHDTTWNKEIGDLCQSLSSMFRNKSASAYRKELEKARKEKKRYYTVGNRNISYLEMKMVEEFPIFKYGKFRGGLLLIPKNKRENPFGSLALRTIGYTNENGVGVGIEKSFNHKLEGEDGKQYMIRQPGGTYIRVAGKEVTYAKDGYDIRTTIDIDIQESAEKALREQLSKSDLLEGGTAVVMEVATGAIRAIVNMKKSGYGKFDESYNYAIGEATEPGSTLKLATLISLIEDGYITLDSPTDGGNGEWYYNKVKFSDTKIGGYGKLTVKDAFGKSSNVCFAKLAVEHYGQSIDDERTYVSRITNMKIGEKFNLDIDGEGYSTIYTPDDTRMWSKVSLPMMAIGYGLLITPLHTLTFYNAIANDGKMMKPYFVEDFEQDGEIIELFKPQVISGAICSKSTVNEVKKALRHVVEKGTASKYNDPRYGFSGKTGTAQIATNGRYVDSEGYRRHQASFAGFFPSDNPKYSCIVVLYSAKTRQNFYGGTWATPVFKQIADNIYATHPEWEAPLKGKGIEPMDQPSVAGGMASEIKTSIQHLPIKNEPRIPSEGWIYIENKDSVLKPAKMKLEMEIMPNVTGFGLKDALYILENEGYKVTFHGNGRVVEQKPAPGDTVSYHQEVILTLKEGK